jgi:CO/xanthine dehydrogenase Mo-binding subunit
MSDYKAIGKPTPLGDGRARVTGAIRYTPDLNMPGVLHARIVASAYAHANIRGINTEAALHVPGVVAVVTAHELTDIAPSSRQRLLLARGRVMFAGQPVALVLATSEAAAEDGVEQVQVNYEPLPAALTIDEAAAEGAPLVWPDGIPESNPNLNSNIAVQVPLSRGDVNAAFAAADVVIERTFTSPMVHQSPLETQAVIVQPDLVTGGATIWASTQGTFETRQSVAAVLDVPESDVRVITTAIGGGFGSKNVLYEPLVAAVAKAVGRPVRLVLTRMEEMAAANPAPPMRITARLGAKQDGTLVALEAAVDVDCGCYPLGFGVLAGLILASMYRVPNYQITAREVLTFKQSAGAYRAPTGPTVAFALDTLVDEIAARLHIDPLDMRLRNAPEKGEIQSDGNPWPTIGVREVLAALEAHPAWQNREQTRAAGRGVGIALAGWPGGSEPAAAACSLHRDGTVHVHVGSVDLSGTVTSFKMMAAEVFGVSPDQVRVISSDTDSAPHSTSAAGSQTIYVVGGAVVNAAREARQQVLAIAANEFEAAVEDIEIVNGNVQVRGVPSKAISLTELAGKTMGFGKAYAPVIAHGRQVQNTSAPVFSAQLAEVEVDKETGVVRLHRLVVIQDVGCAINPLAIEGQMHGGATQGVGWGLYEGIAYDENGQLLTGSWMDYAVPAITQTPEIETVIIEVPSDTGAFGVRGVGEAPVVPTAAAIANAIADATGVRLTDLPMTGPRVLAALQAG